MDIPDQTSSIKKINKMQSRPSPSIPRIVETIKVQRDNVAPLFDMVLADDVARHLPEMQTTCVFLVGTNSYVIEYLFASGRGAFGRDQWRVFVERNAIRVGQEMKWEFIANTGDLSTILIRVTLLPMAKEVSVVVLSSTGETNDDDDTSCAGNTSKVSLLGSRFNPVICSPVKRESFE